MGIRKVGGQWVEMNPPPQNKVTITLEVLLFVALHTRMHSSIDNRVGQMLVLPKQTIDPLQCNNRRKLQGLNHIIVLYK